MEEDEEDVPQSSKNKFDGKRLHPEQPLHPQ